MPEWRRELRARLAALRLAPTREAEIVEELGQHLEDRYRELLARGTGEAEARDAVLEEFEGEGLQEALAGLERPHVPLPPPGVAATGPAGRGGALAQDIRYAFRTLRSRPGFTLVAVLTLALGIGANTAIFSAVRSVMLRPLPYPEPDRLISFWLTAPEKRLPVVRLPDGLFEAYQRESRVFESIAAYSTGGVTLTQGEEPERVAATWATLDYFRVMGIRPMLGRSFVAEEAAPGRAPVAVLSHRLWLRRFSGDRTLPGRSISIDGSPVVVVGVMPPGFDAPEGTDLWFPQPITPGDFDNWYLSLVGRLRPGRRVQEVGPEIASLTDATMLALPARFPDARRGFTRVVAVSLRRDVVGEARTPLLVLLGAVGLVLLIACANIANLLLARAATRNREMAMRCCLGASPRRLVAQLLTESLLLAGAGAAAGLLLASWGTGILRGLTVAKIPRLDETRLDPMVLLFTLVTALAAGLLFGLAPARRAARVDLQDGLRDGGRAGSSTGSRRLSQAFVVSQFALSVILLVGAGLLLRSFRQLLAVDPGFRADNVLAARIELPDTRYRNIGQVRLFYDRLLESVRATPGVLTAGLDNQIPFSSGNSQQELYVEGQLPGPGESVPVVSRRVVTPGYFETMGIPVLKGRSFGPGDDSTAALAVMIDAGLAERYWPGGDPIGKRLRTSRDSTRPWLTIIGEVPSVVHRSLGERPDYYVYQPFAQSPQWATFLVVHARGAPEGLTAAIRRQVVALDPQLPLFDVHTMTQAVENSLGTRRLTDALLGGFAALALVLAAIGIYGVMSLSVAGRVREFGVRLALGATPGEVLRQVLRQGMLLAGTGLALGVAGALALTRFLGDLLFGVAPTDPLTFLGVILILAAVALLSCYLPARRATRTDPIMALRRE